MDLRGETRLVIAVTDEGAAMISFTERDADGRVVDSIRLVAEGGVGEMVLTDIMFAKERVIGPHEDV